MTISLLSWMRLEKAALDNGFDIEGARIDDWRAYSSSQTSLRIWLSEVAATNFIVAFSRWDVWRSLDEVADDWKGPLPPGASGARQTSDQSILHRMLRRSFQLSRILPDEPLQLFRQQTAPLPLTTEAERSVVQRIGQDIFRRGLIDYWEGRCAISGLTVVELLRASHIKPWAQCQTDAERLDVFNGLLLAPHLDALFDRGWMTLDQEGNVLLSAGLDAAARNALGVSERMRLDGLTDQHRLYLNWHRERVYRPLSSREER
jgi:putative restriction endonuclease